VAGIALVILAAIATVAIVLLTGDDEKPGGGGGGGAAPSGEEIPLTAAQDFDPDGDSEEHSEDVGLAIDSNPDTAWTTETYTTPELGKDGVGIWVDAGKPVEARRMEVKTADGSWSASVYGAAEGPPENLSGWDGPIGNANEADADQVFELSTTGGPYRYYLFWITAPTNAESGYGVEVDEIQLVS
jgi:eukaryotic-like serine/threonine-protein kinase